MTIAEAKKEAHEKALDSLGRYKFMMFGYWAAMWVHLNRIDQNHEANPFHRLVRLARLQKNLHFEPKEASDEEQ